MIGNAIKSHKYLSTTCYVCNMGRRDLPDMYAQVRVWSYQANPNCICHIMLCNASRTLNISVMLYLAIHCNVVVLIMGLVFTDVKTCTCYSFYPENQRSQVDVTIN